MLCKNLIALSSIIIFMMLPQCGWTDVRPDPPVFRVDLKPKGSNNFKQEGTAFLIDRRGYFLTASHLFRTSPSDKAFEGEIRLVYAPDGPGAESIAPIENVREIYFQKNVNAPDVSILKTKDALPNSIPRVFDLATKNDRLDAAAMQQFTVLGYPQGVSGTWELLGPVVGVTVMPHGEWPMLMGKPVAVQHGHSGSPLYDSKLIAYGVVYADIDSLLSRRQKLCTQPPNPTPLLCTDEAFAYLQKAQQSSGALFSTLDALSPPFDLVRGIEPTPRLKTFLDDLENPQSARVAARAKLYEQFDDPPMSATELGFLLAHMIQKGDGWLNTSNRLYFIAQAGQRFRIIKPDITSMYFTLTSGEK